MKLINHKEEPTMDNFLEELAKTMENERGRLELQITLDSVMPEDGSSGEEDVPVNLQDLPGMGLQKHFEPD